jgi:hypothetical protein
LKTLNSQRLHDNLFFEDKINAPLQSNKENKVCAGSAIVIFNNVNPIAIIPSGVVGAKVS